MQVVRFTLGQDKQTSELWRYLHRDVILGSVIAKWRPTGAGDTRKSILFFDTGPRAPEANQRPGTPSEK